MIVEDSETQVVVLRHILEGQGWETTCLGNAEEALEWLTSTGEKNFPNLIIIDYHLPGIQGDELCRRLKLNINTRSIPTLILTIDTNEESEKKALESGADDFILKHTDEDIFILKIKSLLRKAKSSHILFTLGSAIFKRSRILVVDNAPDYLGYIEKALNEDGIQIEKAIISDEAILRLENERFDCAVLNIKMPEINGIEICRKALEKRDTIKDPLLILMLTANESKEEMMQALEAGADDFVAKSSDISIIKARLFALLRRKFIQEDNIRIFEELKEKEMEVERSRIEKSAAEAKAVLAERLLNIVEQLEEEIEERKKMEEKIKNYSHELERSNKELESFAYVASHDLQEPLRAISSYLQLVEKRYKNLLDDKGRDFIERAVNGARRMQDMINDLLVYSRISTRPISVEPRSFDDILDRAITNLNAAIERSKAIITRDPLPTIPCDESQVIRLFQNLLSNSIKFCDKPHPIIQISAQEKPNKNQTVFSIKDNGIGIENEYKESIFKIFNRLHGRGKYPGTGIGLAICQKIVGLHGGKMWVESEPGIGSTFYFSVLHSTEANK